MTNEQVKAIVEKAVKNTNVWTNGRAYLQTIEKADGKRYYKIVDKNTGKTEYKITEWNKKAFRFKEIADVTM